VHFQQEHSYGQQEEACGLTSHSVLSKAPRAPSSKQEARILSSLEVFTKLKKKGVGVHVNGGAIYVKMTKPTRVVTQESKLTLYMMG